MKRILLLVASVALLSTSTGCCSSWGSFWNRGARCGCGPAVGATSVGVTGCNSCDNTGVYNGAVVPQGTIITPGT